MLKITVAIVQQHDKVGNSAHAMCLGICRGDMFVQANTGSMMKSQSQLLCILIAQHHSMLGTQLTLTNTITTNRSRTGLIPSLPEQADVQQ